MNKSDNIAALIDPLEGQLGYELRRASVAMTMTLANELESLGLRPSDASMMMLISSNPGRTQTDVGRALRIKPANMVPIVNKLLMSGIVDRVPSEGRSLSLFLTEKGKSLYKQVKRIFERHEKRFTRSLSGAARQELIHSLRSICSEACRSIEK
jgi:DNA-binding MarR family transcriptional regulator